VPVRVQGLEEVAILDELPTAGAQVTDDRLLLLLLDAQHHLLLLLLLLLPRRRDGKVLVGWNGHADRGRQRRHGRHGRGENVVVVVEFVVVVHRTRPHHVLMLVRMVVMRMMNVLHSDQFIHKSRNLQFQRKKAGILKIDPII
jgi:hypothetical protein